MGPLSPAHRSALEAAAIHPDQMEHMGSEGADIIFRHHSPSGSRVLEQRKLGNPTGDAKYLTPSGERLLLVTPQGQGNPERVADSRRPILMSEGTKQTYAAASYLHDHAVIGFLGAQAWAHDGGRPLPDFEEIDWEGRTVTVAMDADIATNLAVWEAAKRLKDHLEVTYGAGEVRFAVLAGENKDGLDDFLAQAPVAKRRARLERLVDNASRRLPPQPRAPGNPFLRQGGGILVADLYRDIMADTPLAALEDKSIATYVNGTYHNGDSLEFEAAVSKRLGNDFKRQHLIDTKEYCLAQCKAERRTITARQDRHLVNVRNGLLDPLTGELHPHDPEWLSLIQYNVRYDPEATCPHFDAWLVDRIGSDQVEPLLQVSSLFLDPTVTPMRSVYIFGPTRTGKSTYTRILKALNGEAHTGAVRLHDLAGPFSAAELYGKTLNLGGDIPSTHLSDLSTLKAATGGDVLDANKKYGKRFRFTNVALLINTGNDISTVGELSEAYFDRMHPVEFFGSFAGRLDPAVEAKIMDELPGIFNRLIAAYRRRVANVGGAPMAPPAWVREKFETESDPVRRWMREELTPVETGGTELSPLHANYKKWAENQGTFHPLGRHQLGKLLADAGFPTMKSNGRKVRKLKMRADGDELGTFGEAPRDPDSVGYGGENLGGMADSTLPYPIDEAGGSIGTQNSVININSNYSFSTTSQKTLYWDERSLGTLGLGPMGYVALDLETAGAEELHARADFIRLIGMAGEGVFTDPERVRDFPLVAHNGFAFDFPALGHVLGADWLWAAGESGNLADSMVLAILCDPPNARMPSPRSYYSLAKVAERLGVPGKTDDLKALAKRHGGFDRIPLDDPDYRAYLVGDVVALDNVMANLKPPSDAYARREMRLMARLSYAMTFQGWRLDMPLLGERLAAVAEVEAAGRANLERFGLPTERPDGTPYKKPHTTKEGREAIIRALADAGVTDYPTTPTGNLSTKEADWAGAKLPAKALEVMEAVWALNGARSVYGTVEKYRTGDRVHPTVSPLQASGRFSITEPGLTVFGKRDGRATERAIFLPDEGEVLVSFDLNQIDARMVAARSQDPAYMALFQDPDKDSHMEIAMSLWGDPKMRTAAKVIGHSYNYGAGLQSIAANSGLDLDTVQAFDEHMRSTYPRLVEWKDEQAQRAETEGLVDNGWGRMMSPDPDRSYTQGPALQGQGAARDAMAEGVLRLPEWLAKRLKAWVHDEVVFSVPADAVEDAKAETLAALEFDWEGVPVLAGYEGQGQNWAQVYEEETHG